MASLGGGLIAAAADTVDQYLDPASSAAEPSQASLILSRNQHLDPASSAAEPSQASPVMPHLALFGQALDNAYPPMTAPEDEDLQDADLDEDDATLQTGLREAVAIAADARDQGRKRKMSPITQPSTTTNKENENVVKLVNEQKEATIRSALGRRRSKRKVAVRELQDLPIHPFAGIANSTGFTISTSSTEGKLLSDAKLCSCCLSLEYSASHRVVVLCASDARVFDQAKQVRIDHLAYPCSNFDNSHFP